MNWVNIFPVFILTHNPHDISEEHVSLYKEAIIDSPSSIANGGFLISNNQNFLENPLFDTLTQNILNLSKSYLNEMGHLFEDLQISSSWSVVFNQGGETDWHTHGNSYLSGVYYLTSGTAIGFENPLNNLLKFVPEFKSDIKSFRGQTHFKIDPTPNLLILFPSYLQHKVIKSSDNNSRMCISFNIIPKGEFGQTTQKIYL